MEVSIRLETICFFSPNKEKFSHRTKFDAMECEAKMLSFGWILCSYNFKHSENNSTSFKLIDCKWSSIAIKQIVKPKPIISTLNACNIVVGGSQISLKGPPVDSLASAF